MSVSASGEAFHRVSSAGGAVFLPFFTPASRPGPSFRPSFSLPLAPASRPAPFVRCRTLRPAPDAVYFSSRMMSFPKAKTINSISNARPTIWATMTTRSPGFFLVTIS